MGDPKYDFVLPYVRFRAALGTIPGCLRLGPGCPRYCNLQISVCALPIVSTGSLEVDCDVGVNCGTAIECPAADIVPHDGSGSLMLVLICET